MAKTDEMKFIDQHLEKIVLGVCVLIMAYGIFQWVLSSPQRSEVPDVGGRIVPAPEVDAALLREAQNVRRRERTTPPPKPAPDYSKAISDNRRLPRVSAAESWGEPRMVMIAPIRPEAPAGISLKKITDILDTYAPKIVEVKGARELVNCDGGIDKLVFRGKAEFDRGALLKAWNQVFRGSAMDEVTNTVLAVEIERCAVLDNGQLGPATKVTRVVMPAPKGGEPVKDVAIPKYTGENADVVRKAIETFTNQSQRNVLMPPYWKVWSMTDKRWTTPWNPVVEPEPDDDKTDAAAKPAPVVVQAGAAGTTEIWFHDTDVTVQRQYTYRARLVFISPLYTYDDVAYKGKPEDALVKTITSAWSDWVTGEAIPRTTQYFLTGTQAVGGKRQLFCTIFTRSLGQVVKQKFEVFPGRIIGGLDSKSVMNPVNGVAQSKVVDFATNATLVHVDFEKKFVNRFGRTDVTQELICSENGKLVSHILVKNMPDEDPRAVEYRKLQAQADGQTP
jgi:hypothetical protein